MSASLDAERLLRAMRKLAVGGELCATLRHLSQESGLSETAVRRCLGELTTEPAGQAIRPAGRRGATTVWRVKPDPLAPAGGATSPTSPPTAGDDGTEVGVPSESDRLDAGRPPVASVREGGEPAADELSAEEHERRRQAGLKATYAQLDRWNVDEEIGEPDQPGGECGECHRQARRRYSLGVFVLCRDCRIRRARAKVRLALHDGPATEPEPALDDELVGQAVDAFLEQATPSTNGHGDPDWIDELPDY